jgi:uncharacterized membrane protein YGL010W
MSEIDSWLERYEKSHQALTNPVVYWAAVPMVILGTIGILWHLPIPVQFFEISPLLNWGSAFLMATAIYYFIISLSLAIGMLPFLLGLAAIQSWLAQSPYPQLGVSVSLLISGAVGLWLSRRGTAGSAKAVVQDFQLMMIGPVWLLSVLYRYFRISF